VLWDFFWVARTEGTGNQRTLIGTGGFMRGRTEGTLLLGYAVLPEYRGKGYGSEAVRSLTEWALEDPGVDRLVAIAAPDSTASIRVLEKNGFAPTGDEDGAGNLVFTRYRDPHTVSGTRSGSTISPPL
jgi:RimJ/RimL family protein N-acetyltransferase